MLENIWKIHLWVTKFIMICFLLSFSNLVKANSCHFVEYNLDLADIKNSVLRVEMTLQGSFEDEIAVDLPFKWAGVNYVKQVVNVQTEPEYKMRFVNNSDDHYAVITIPHHLNKIKITYEIHQKEGNPSDVHEAMIRTDLVHSPGYGIFATPVDWKESDATNISINWLNIEQGWKTISSHSITNRSNLKLKTQELLHAIYAAGNVRMYKISDDSSPVFLSLYGKFDITDDQILSDLDGIVIGQRTFFNDFDFPYYAISLIEGDNPASMGGTRLHNSFTAFLPKAMQKIEYYILFAHEHLHNWIGGKFKNNKDEELNYWWSEGFTEFYSRLIALRTKAIDRDVFINEVNQFLRAYYLSPVNKEPNSRIQKDFWNNYDVEKLPYNRGFVFAMYLNNLIKWQNLDKSLDDVMHDLIALKAKSKFSNSLFKNIMRKHVKNGIDKEFTQFIDKGDIIPTQYLNLPIEKRSMGKYYLGFNRDVFLEDKLIKEIDIKSNAYKAGLRNGQQVVSFEVPKGRGEPNQIITIKTTDGIFKFKPEHYDKIEIFQLKDTLSPEEVKQFDKFFGVQ